MVPVVQLCRSDFDVYRMYDEMFARPCVPYQKGQPKEHAVTGKDKIDRCKMFTDQDRPCKPEEPPPCSFTPESFIRTWMNGHGVEMVPLGM